jgi:hypothetical protein
MPDKIRQLIAADKVERAIEELIAQVTGKDENLANQLIELQATLTKNRKDSRRGLISSEQENNTRTRVRYAVLDILEEIASVSGAVAKPATPVSRNTEAGTAAPTVFISYNHSDIDVANKLKQALEKKGIIVRIDHAILEPGANIQNFIESSIRDTDVTLSIVSNRSLLSAWVALESINTFYHQKFEKDKKFIACYIDDDFFQTGFRLKATRQIDAKIAEIDKLLPEYVAEKIDPIDLNNQKSRLYKLRNDLGDILLRLKESLCLDIRGEKLDTSVTKIVETIT